MVDHDEASTKWSLEQSGKVMRRFAKRPTKKAAAELLMWKGRHMMEVREIDKKLAQLPIDPDDLADWWKKQQQ